MDASLAPRGAVLDAWREQGADRADPVRFHRIEALHRRASGLAGEARRLADERLAVLVADYARLLRQAGERDGAAFVTPAQDRRGALGELADLLAARRGVATQAPAGAGDHGNAAAPGVGVQPADGDLGAVRDFRRIWSQVRTRSQLRRSLESAPTDAGPLNSGSLVHRALGLMQDASPGYLQHFMAYIDALSCLERLCGDADLSGATPAAPGGKAAGRTRARKRRA